MNRIERSPPRLDSEALRTFAAVARHGNVTRAALELHRTQSAISVQIKRLEKELGGALFERQARGVSLTPAGEKLHAAARRIIALLDRTAAEMNAAPLEGRVAVGIPDDYGAEPLASVLALFAARHPGVIVDIRCGFSTDFPRALERGELDIAVFAFDRDEGEGRCLLREETVWVAARGYEAPADDPVPLALFDRACWWRDAALESLERVGRPHRIAYSSESVAGVKAAVKAGLAVGMLAQGTVDTQSMRVLGEDQGFPALPVSCLMLVKRKEASSPALEAMAAAIEEAFSVRAA